MYRGNFTNNETLEGFYADIRSRLQECHGEDYTAYLDDIEELAVGDYCELGVHQGASLAAALLSRANSVTAYDINLRHWIPHSDLFKKFARNGDKPLKVMPQNALDDKAKWLPCDFLFCDTLHTARHIRRVLRLHAPRVRNIIMVHDTNLPGRHEATLIDGWQVMRQVTLGSGHTILERCN